MSASERELLELLECEECGTDVYLSPATARLVDVDDHSVRCLPCAFRLQEEDPKWL